MTPPLDAGGGSGGLARHGSNNLLSLLGKHHGHGGAGGGNGLLPSNPICASLPRAEMTIIPPAMQHRCAGAAGVPGVAVQLRVAVRVHCFPPAVH